MDNQLNKEYVTQSLINQIATLSLQIAERDALITEQQIELETLKKAQVDDMNKEANNE